MSLAKRILVLGGGPAGLAAAINLAERGLEVELVEKRSTLGGNALTVCCKAVQDECQSCGACVLADLLRRFPEVPRIQLHLKSELKRLASRGRELVCTLTNGKTLSVQGLIVATGFSHMDAREKGPYGYGTVPAVTTGREVEETLHRQGQAAYDALAPQRIAFVQCVGSRDVHLGRGYCSQVCCRYALRLARLFHHRFPQAEITVFKMDLQHGDRAMSETWTRCQKEGIRIVAGLPAVIREAPDAKEKALFSYEDTLTGTFHEERFDLVVLSVGIRPFAGARELAECLGINLDPFGFLAACSDGVSTLRPGVFVAGTCQGPRSIVESVAHALRAAEACYRYVQEAV